MDMQCLRLLMISHNERVVFNEDKMDWQLKGDAPEEQRGAKGAPAPFWFILEDQTISVVEYVVIMTTTLSGWVL